MARLLLTRLLLASALLVQGQPLAAVRAPACASVPAKSCCRMHKCCTASCPMHRARATRDAAPRPTDGCELTASGCETPAATSAPAAAQPYVIERSQNSAPAIETSRLAAAPSTNHLSRGDEPEPPPPRA